MPEPAIESLIGRDAELARLRAALGAIGNEAAVVSIEGEPGIGKTTLLEALARLADADRHLVLEGRATEFERNDPFAVFLDALNDYLGSVNPRTIRPTDDRGRAELARVFPALADLDTGDASGTGEERYRSHAAVRDLLAGLASSRPVLITLDDLHWADEASLELLSHLLRHRPPAALLIAIAFRTGQAPERLTAALGEAGRSGAYERIEIGPLSADEAREMLGTEVDVDLYRRTGGNPFYLRQVARAGADATPDDVIEAVSRELAELDDSAAELLRGAAVIGDTFEPDLAAEAAGLDADAALEALDGLIVRELVHPGDTPRRFRFRHPIVRHAVYEAAPTGWRLGAHGRAEAALKARGASAVARAHHLERSAIAGDDAAVATLTEAAEAVAPRAPDAAAYWLAAALRLLPDDDVGRRLMLLVPRARHLAVCGRYDNSLAALDEILSLMPPNDPSLRARVIASQAKVKQLIGRTGEARAELTAAMDALPDRSSPEATTLKLELAADAFFAAEFERCQELLGEALADAEGHGDRATVAAATGLLSAALYLADRCEEARVQLDRAFELIAALDETELAAHVSSHSWTALGAICLERFDDAIALLDRAIAAAQATGQGHLPALLRTTRALALISLGRLEEAWTQLDAAVEGSILTANPVFLTWGLSLQSWAATIRGDMPTALRVAESAAASTPNVDDPVSATAACWSAEAVLASGQPGRARDELLARVGGPDLPRIERGLRSQPYELLTRAELELGDIEAAAGWAQRSADAAAGLGIEGRTADAERARAAVALANAQPADALAAALASAAGAEGAGLPIHSARARILAGRAQAADGERDAAVATLEAARAELEALGASYYADEAGRELRRLGVRAARPGRQSDAVAPGALGALSAREREIAELVAAGRRNRDIAEALFLSVRTVEGHLARIFRKLEVTSRTQLGALIRGDDA